MKSKKKKTVVKKEEKNSDKMLIEIRIHIYKIHLLLFIGHTAKEIVAMAKKRGVKDDTFPKYWIPETQNTMDGNASGFCGHLGENNRDILIWLRKKPRVLSEFGVLYHEMIHAIDFIFHDIDEQEKGFDKRGISEARAYLYEYLIIEAQRKLWI